MIITYKYELKIITAFLKQAEISTPCFKKKGCLIHYLILFGSHNINAFFKASAKI
jgi:hypothetical protein